MKKKQKQYVLIPSISIHQEGVSIYKILREGDSSEQLVRQYLNSVKSILNTKLKNLTTNYEVPAKEVERIQTLIKELIYASELKDKCEDISNTQAL